MDRGRGQARDELHWMGRISLGPLDSRQPALAAAIVGEPESFVLEDSVQAAELFNRSGRRRGSFIDCMIAATAIRNGASFATANHADFKHFPGLPLEPDRRSRGASS
jgi:predicted nucleic acid-binding protein